MRDPVFRAVVAQKDTAVPGDSGRLPSTNTLLGRHGVIGVKTGSGTAAGGNLMWASRVEGRLVLGVILGQAAGTNPVAGKAAALEAGARMSAAVEQWLRAAAPRARVSRPAGAAKLRAWHGFSSCTRCTACGPPSTRPPTGCGRPDTRCTCPISTTAGWSAPLRRASRSKRRSAATSCSSEP
ncbi:hypothetical protein GCM10020001_105400 [Nonomuraea salmonea]